MNGLSTPYAVLREQLIEHLRLAPWPSPETGFSHFVYNALNEHTPPFIHPLTAFSERLNETPILASFGYYYADPATKPSPQIDNLWATHFRRLANRQAFPLDRESYFYRPLDLLGLCLGARICAAITESDRDWLRRTLIDGEARHPQYSRAQYLGAVAAAQLGVNWEVRSTPALADLSLSHLALIHWLLQQETMAKRLSLANIPSKELASEILKRCFLACNSYSDIADGTLILSACDSTVDRIIGESIDKNWITQANTTQALATLTTLCSRFPFLAKQLGHRYNNRETIVLRDEYDVQDVLHAILKLHFRDIRPEEWTPSYAGSSSRIDFLLKPEQVVIEAKMTRKGLDQKELVNQLSIDIQRYRSHPDCRALVCFVYDPEGRCTDPIAIETDLRRIESGYRVSVHVEPKAY